MKSVLRVVSLVPSWTETLIEASREGCALSGPGTPHAHEALDAPPGLSPSLTSVPPAFQVVGRTRFCLHPQGFVHEIPAVGGTKSFDANLVKSLKPDLILLDREENTREMADLAQTIAPIHVTHVQSLRDMPRELRRLAQVLRRDRLAADDGAAESLLEPSDRASVETSIESFEAADVSLLAMADRFERRLARPEPRLSHGPFAYCIWKDPWMAVGRDTFIASVLEHVGFDLAQMVPLTTNREKYPKFELSEIPAGALMLLSSEPYPFGKPGLLPLPELAGYEVRVINGESFSWFGLRALKFLESNPQAYLRHLLAIS